MRGHGRLDRHDPLEARFRSAINKREAKKTGLVRSEDYTHICTECGKQTVNPSPNPPKFYEGLRMISGDPCTSKSHETYNNLEVEAMPIGRVIMDNRRERGW